MDLTSGTSGGTIKVVIPAGSQSTTFCLDPHRCPDNSTSSGKQASSDSSSTISVGIMDLDQIVTAPVPQKALSYKGTSKKLKVTFSGKGGLGISSEGLEAAIETAFMEGTGKSLFYLQTENDVLFDNDIYEIVDKVAGRYGSNE